MPRKSKYKTVTVFESFVVAAETLKSDDEKGKLYSAIMRYSLYGEEPDLDGICSALFELMKPNIDKSNCRRDARSREQTGEQTGNKPGNKPGTNRGTNRGTKTGKCSGFALPKEEEEEEDNNSLTTFESDNAPAPELTESENQLFSNWLEVWREIHGDGKPMPVLARQAQLERLLWLPAEIRVDALRAAIAGTWKNIQDIRESAPGSGKREDKTDAKRYVPRH